MVTVRTQGCVVNIRFESPLSTNSGLNKCRSVHNNVRCRINPKLVQSLSPTGVVKTCTLHKPSRFRLE